MCCSDLNLDSCHVVNLGVECVQNAFVSLDPSDYPVCDFQSVPDIRFSPSPPEFGEDAEHNLEPDEPAAGADLEATDEDRLAVQAESSMPLTRAEKESRTLLKRKETALRRAEWRAKVDASPVGLVRDLPPRLLTSLMCLDSSAVVSQSGFSSLPSGEKHLSSLVTASSPT